MDANHSDDLNDIERRLAGWQPSQAGLDADRMLFAAGRASVRPILWPVAAGCLAVLAAVLAIGLIHEREEKLALALLLQSRPISPALPSPVPATQPGPLASVPPEGYLSIRRALEQDRDGWPEPAAGPAGRPATSPVILRACDREAFLDP